MNSPLVIIPVVNIHVQEVLITPHLHCCIYPDGTRTYAQCLSS